MKIVVGIGLFLAAQASFAGCWLSEYNTIGREDGVPNTRVQAPQEPAIVHQPELTLPGEFSALNDDTTLVYIYCEEAAHYLFSAAGTNADQDDPPIAAGVGRYFAVQPGNAWIVDIAADT